MIFCMYIYLKTVLSVVSCNTYRIHIYNIYFLPFDAEYYNNNSMWNMMIMDDAILWGDTKSTILC